MKKLSTLSNNIELTVSRMDGISIMTKGEFLDSCFYLDIDKTDTNKTPKITIPVPVFANFSFDNAFENCGDEMHEYWQENIDADIENSNLNLKEIEDKINAIFEKNPSYYEGEEIEIDC